MVHLGGGGWSSLVPWLISLIVIKSNPFTSQNYLLRQFPNINTHPKMDNVKNYSIFNFIFQYLTSFRRLSCAPRHYYSVTILVLKESIISGCTHRPLNVYELVSSISDVNINMGVIQKNIDSLILSSGLRVGDLWWCFTNVLEFAYSFQYYMIHGFFDLPAWQG